MLAELSSRHEDVVEGKDSRLKKGGSMITPKSFIVIWQFSELQGIRAQKNKRDGFLESICYHLTCCLQYDYD